MDQGVRERKGMRSEAVGDLGVFIHFIPFLRSVGGVVVAVLEET